jgi:multidrug efflux pump subunit AcrB
MLYLWAWLGIRVALDSPTSISGALVEVLFALATGAVLALASIFLSRGRRAWRSPVIVINVLALPVAYYLATSGEWRIATPLGVVSLTVLIGLLAGSEFFAQMDERSSE